MVDPAAKSIAAVPRTAALRSDNLESDMMYPFSSFPFRLAEFPAAEMTTVPAGRAGPLPYQHRLPSSPLLYANGTRDVQVKSVEVSVVIVKQVVLHCRKPQMQANLLLGDEGWEVEALS